MHLKRVIVASDDVHTRAWVQTGIGGLDVALFYIPVADLPARIASDPGDLIIADVRREPEDIVSMVETATATGAELKLLLLVELEALDRLRIPVRLPADFVARTSSHAEVAARVRTLLWPGEDTAPQEIVRVDDLTLNLATYQAYLGDSPIEFTFLEYTLFSFLVTHPNRTYSREVLLNRVWGTDYYGGARTVDVHVRRVRSKLGPELARRLETVRNVGYLWRQ